MQIHFWLCYCRFNGNLSNKNSEETFCLTSFSEVPWAYSFYKIFMNYVTTETVREEVIYFFKCSIKWLFEYCKIWETIYSFVLSYIYHIVYNSILEIYTSPSSRAALLSRVKKGKKSSMFYVFHFTCTYLFQVLSFWC